LDDVVANDRREILLIIEGSKDGLAAMHFADVEGRLSKIGIVVALGAGVKLLSDDVEKFRGRRVRIFGDADGPVNMQYPESGSSSCRGEGDSNFQPGWPTL
jgi:hypothetical protein